VRIRTADPSEGERLREIAIAAKSYWGYDLERVRAWAAGGDFSPAAILSKEVYVAEAKRQVAGWAALVPRGEVCWLADLWIDPAWIGQGVGTLLFQHAADRAGQLGASRLEWEAEPNAIGFYERMNARFVRDGHLSSWGRIVPVMAVDLSVPKP
jgi:GNAT superfamily N-acetyltransferase